MKVPILHHWRDLACVNFVDVHRLFIWVGDGFLSWKLAAPFDSQSSAKRLPSDIELDFFMVSVPRV